ncbi:MULTISPECIES: potassium channel family protein [Pseudomonas]|uniref:potassium channel family protein n=1 Tax=Pseudomonas TaxID=286 RepID=UPI00073030D5|nr:MULTISPECIES: potassium channel family protein [unclassified Pseudomonas]KSW27235.1 Ion channel [Pseudomonas sp. ADP]OBP09932.1 Ion channel [Pseudomonas sp. EGD-AKN5]QOF83896.1 two pore domain potassium channel family protein [Pseudomonas sp. ADPe]
MPALAHLKRHPSAILLFVQLLGVLLYPWMDDSTLGRALFGAFGLLVLGLALQVVKRSPVHSWIAAVLALLVLTLGLLDLWLASRMLELLVPALEAAFYFYAAASLIAYMNADQRATTDELYAAGATFTLLAWAFAHLFSFCQLAVPGSFSAALNAEAPRTWTELLFLSFTTLSGVGLGDILPLTPAARSLVMIEEFAGVMYLALVVSRLIAMSVSRR